MAVVVTILLSVFFWRGLVLLRLMLFARLRLRARRLRLRSILVERRMHVVVLIVRADGRAVAIALLIVVWLRLRGVVAAFVLRRHRIVMRSRLSWITATIVAVHSAIPVVRWIEWPEASVAGRLIARLPAAAVAGTLPIVDIAVLAGIWPAIGRALLIERARASVCDRHRVIGGRRLYVAVRRSVILRIVCA